MMPEFAYATLDVFTTTRFGGNQLAVIPDARGLTDIEMQQIAAEFNYSETTFVLPPQDPANTARVRIFVRTAEIPFAGHPNVGTAFVLGRQDGVFGKITGSSMRFEEGAGLVEVEIVRDRDVVVGARFRAPRALEIGATVDTAALARCVSLDAGAIVTERHAPTRISVGLPFVVAEMDVGSLSQARPNIDAFAAAAATYGEADLGGRLSVFLYARTGQGIDRLRTRMFAPLSGTVEDPATGSASAALAAFLLSLDARADAQQRISIEQGAEMGRPSAIEVEVGKRGGRVHEVFVEGRCVPVMRGMLAV
jgi:trans-2,3-dihydro-3-hydroxyanthranilate isomerase